ncbi:flagellar hook capping FlgD N-terminal domain-containing protein [Paenibacillus fonticola]|uniref:flagellar hook capping FlgD N-terminal domain-containing protein n=1 Tax=Paenibacillus fonticola TaxID=379896 RepID=UPI00036BA5BE|nr:flagellar hook capping FlgD N-terminal domain-containing protein [Paenibacillus fonticola]
MSNFTNSVMWPGYAKSNVPKKSTEDNQALGKDQFLKILITQLQNQDPMQPLQDKEFIAQMATFTSVEQLMNISKQLDVMNQSLGSVSGLIGKKVSWISTEYTGEYNIKTGKSTVTSTGSGIVEAIVIRENVQYAKVGDKEIKLTDILQIDDVPKNGEVPKDDDVPKEEMPPENSTVPEAGETPAGSTAGAASVHSNSSAESPDDSPSLDAEQQSETDGNAAGEVDTP